MKTIESTPLPVFDRVLEWFSLFLLIGLWGLVLFAYLKMPDSIPIHFNASGQADRYGSKGTIFILPVIGSFIFALFTVLGKQPNKLNYITTLTPGNTSKQYLYAGKMLRCLKFSILLLFVLLVFMTYLAAMGKTNGLGSFFLPLSLSIIFIPLCYYLYKSIRAK